MNFLNDKRKIFLIAVLIATVGLVVGLAIGIPLSQKEDNLNRAKAILEKYPLIDGHNDLSYMIRENFRNQFGKFDLQDLTKYILNGTNGVTHTDLIRLKEGLLGGQFWAVYADCNTLGKDAVRIHLEQIDTIKRLINRYSDRFQFVTNSNEISVAFKNKKIASLIGLESGHAIDSSLALLRIFYSLGVRYMTLTHNCNLPWATNHLIDRLSNASSYGGLNAFGKVMIKEMNRIGMIVDLSHVSTKTMEDALEVSEAPVMFSHSSVYSICNVSRNVKDHVLDKLKENNGIIMINFYNGFVNCKNAKTTLQDVIDHIKYVKNRIGIDHVGIGADYDGVDEVPEDLEDVSKYPNLFKALLDDNWSEEDLAKLAGGNVIRVLKAVEDYANKVKDTPPIDDIIDPSDLNNENYKNCRTSF